MPISLTERSTYSGKYRNFIVSVSVLSIGNWKAELAIIDVDCSVLSTITVGGQYSIEHGLNKGRLFDLDMIGNGDMTQFCNLGLGSLLLANAFKVLHRHFQTVCSGPIEFDVFGYLCCNFDNAPAISHLRRVHFFKKFGFYFSNEDDHSSYIVTTLSRAVDHINSMSVPLIDFYSVQQPLAPLNLHFTFEQDTRALNELCSKDFLFKVERYRFLLHKKNHARSQPSITRSSLSPLILIGSFSFYTGNFTSNEQSIGFGACLFIATFTNLANLWSSRFKGFVSVDAQELAELESDIKNVIQHHEHLNLGLLKRCYYLYSVEFNEKHRALRGNEHVIIELGQNKISTIDYLDALLFIRQQSHQQQIHSPQLMLPL